MAINKKRDSSPFSEEEKLSVWAKGTEAPPNDPRAWRRDVCGYFMYYDAYGNRNSKYGWEVDHIKPIQMGGTDDLSNLQPLWWETNSQKGDTFPWDCSKLGTRTQ